MDSARIDLISIVKWKLGEKGKSNVGKPLRPTTTDTTSFTWSGRPAEGEFVLALSFFFHKVYNSTIQIYFVLLTFEEKPHLQVLKIMKKVIKTTVYTRIHVDLCISQIEKKLSKIVIML